MNFSNLINLCDQLRKLGGSPLAVLTDAISERVADIENTTSGISCLSCTKQKNCSQFSNCTKMIQDKRGGFQQLYRLTAVVCKDYEVINDPVFKSTTDFVNNLDEIRSVRMVIQEKQKQNIEAIAEAKKYIKSYDALSDHLDQASYAKEISDNIKEMWRITPPEYRHRITDYINCIFRMKGLNLDDFNQNDQEFINSVISEDDLDEKMVVIFKYIDKNKEKVELNSTLQNVFGDRWKSVLYSSQQLGTVRFDLLIEGMI